MKEQNIIFLAHASEDKGFVREVYKKLKIENLNPWLDEQNLMPGVKWDQVIVETIKNSRFFLAFLSKNSVSKNGYIQKELKMALSELEKKTSEFIYFIPVLIEDIEIPNISVGTINMSDYQASKLFEKNSINKLVNYLKKIIETNNIKPNTVYDTRFKVDGRNAWFIIEVEEHMNYEFLKMINSKKTFDLDDYGIIHYSGWEEPNEKVKQKCKERFGLPYD